MRIAPAILLAALVACTAGCQQVVPATSHAPTTADQVYLYQTQPSKYEILGDVSDSKNVKYGEGFTADSVVDALREKAAALGANGILLTIPPDQETNPPTNLQVGGRYKGYWYAFSVDKAKGLTVVAKAIWVLQR